MEQRTIQRVKLNYVVDDIKKVEVLIGPHTAVYGSAAFFRSH